MAMNIKFQPQIRKAKRVVGRTLTFRNVTLSDAEFILSLRTNENKSRFLSQVPDDLEAQRRWLEDYAVCQDQAYFIIEYQEVPVGTVRLYDPQSYSFCWGSWILTDGCPIQAAMESALMVYYYAIDVLGFNSAHLDVRKGNERVWKFHEHFGAKRIAETELNYLYQLNGEAIATSRKRYQCFLKHVVCVENL